MATYRRPGAVVRRLVSEGPREDRALFFLMVACGLVFVAQLPRLAREAHLTGTELNMLLGGTLLAWIVIAPLILYALAAIAHIIGRVLGGQGSGYGARVALFWALLASAPLMLLRGLVAGFIGEGLQLDIVDFVWFLCFVWFWVSGSIAQERGA